MNKLLHISQNKILVVEDDDDSREFLRDALELEGYEITLAKDGEEGLNSIRRNRPNLVLLDIMIPKINGLDLCRMVRADKSISSTKIIFVTAKGSMEEKIEGFEAGGDDFLAKPFSPKELLARIQAHLRADRLAYELEISEKRYKSLIENSPDGIILFTEFDKIFYTNKRAIKMFPDCNLENSVNLNLDDLAKVSPVFLVISRLLRLIKDSRETINRLVRDKDERDNTRYFEVTAISVETEPLANSINQITIRDVTEKNNMEKILSKTEKINALGILTAGIAHEVNNPLTGISNATQLLSRPKLPEEKRKDLLELIISNVARISRIIEDLHVFSRRERSEASEFIVSEAIQETLTLIRYQKGKNKIEIDFVNEADEASVKGSKNHFQQIMINLLLNATQAIEEIGTIRVVLRKSSDQNIAIIQVTDTGCGIPQKQIERIFDPFFTTKIDWNGTGLGLAVSYRLVQILHGTISVKSEVGSGTTFTITLPMS